MSEQGFIFGGNSGISYDELQRRRKIAEQLMQGGQAPRNVGEGLHAIGKAIAGRMMTNRLDKREAGMRQQFNQDFASVAPGGVPKAAELYSDPMANPAQKKILEALLAGRPAYARGTNYSQGGAAIVGENGPEVVNMPEGSQVIPTHLLKLYSAEMSGAVPSGTTEMMMQQNFPTKGRMFQEGNEDDDAPEWYRSLDPARRQEFDAMPPEEKRRINDGFERGLPVDDLFNPNGMDLREMIGPDSNLRPQQNFNDAAAFRTADLDAFKMMQLQPEYGPAVEADVNTTEGGRLALLRRMMFADATLEDPRLAQAMTKMDQSVAGRLGALGRLYTSDEFELGKLMSEQFANAVLRNDSGAAAPDSEVRRYAEQYFPLPNDSPSQLQAKKALRREVIRSMVQALGGDAAPAAQQVMDEINALKGQADVPDGSLTGGAAPISAEDEEFLKSLGMR